MNGFEKTFLLNSKITQECTMSGDDSCSSNQEDENAQFTGKNKHQMLHVPSFVVQIKQSLIGH